MEIKYQTHRTHLRFSTHNYIICTIKSIYTHANIAEQTHSISKRRHVQFMAKHNI